jgi:hypothetical protein
MPCTWKAWKMVAADRRFLGLPGFLRAGAVAAEKLADVSKHRLWKNSVTAL